MSIRKGMIIASAALASAALQAAQDYPIAPAVMTNVTVTGGFWLPRFETNRLVTVKTDFANCEKARIPNFRNAAAHKWGSFKGIPFDDSDVYKVIEGAAYTLATHPDAALEAYVDGVNEAIAGAQERDGYLYTARTLGFTYGEKDGKTDFGMMGPTRWTRISHGHELYNVGHLYEAAVAYWEATGKRTLLDVAMKSADLVDRTFGPAPTQLKDAPGHEEIELALCKLYRATGERRYLDLAKFFLEARGREGAAGDGKVFAQSGELVAGSEMEAKNSYWQNHIPVVRQREAVGHAVRATYLYCGMADVAALTGNADYVTAIDALWENVVGRKLALNGSVGARPHGETFGANWELPNEGAYNETCASIGNALWNERMFLMHGEAKYIDVLERAVYNGILSGVSLGGDEFFYPNPLASKGGYKRSKWFGCSCCPVNDVRFIPQVPSMAYASKKGVVYWNLFVEGEATIDYNDDAAGGFVRVRQKTGYPWSGRAELVVLEPGPGASQDWSAAVALKVRIPGWARGRPVPSDLYVQTSPSSASDVSLSVNGERVAAKVGDDGYVTIERKWKVGDKVVLDLPMPVKRIRSNEKVAADRGRLAVERGPIVYCAEGFDNGGKAYGAVLPADATFEDTTISIGDKTFPALKASNGLVLIPYFLWGNREPGNELQVWFAEKP